MTIENVRRTCEDAERDPILKQMSAEGYTLVTVTDDGWDRTGRVTYHYSSLYFTRTVPKRQFDPCCERDYDGDGNCHIHSAPGVLRNKAMQPEENP